MSAINARCGASHQSIAENDPCRVMLISQSASYGLLEVAAGGKSSAMFGIASTTVYPNCFWKPESPFLRAVYDDYGMSRLVLETWFDRAQAATLFGDLYQADVATGAGENRFHDLAFDFVKFVKEHAPALAELFAALTFASPPVVPKDDELDAELQHCWTYLNNMVRRHRAFTRVSGAKIRPMETFIVHERAYQALCDTTSAKSNYEGVSFELNAFLRHGIEKARQYADRGELCEEGDDAQRREQLHWVAFQETLRGWVQSLDIDGCFNNHTARYCFDRACRKLYRHELGEDDFIIRVALWMKDRLAICALEIFEIKLGPMTYVGGDFKNVVGSSYAKFVTGVSEQVTADRLTAD